MARQVAGAVLEESLRVLALRRESRDRQLVNPEPQAGKRAPLSRVIIDRFDFKQSALERFAIACRRGCATGDHIGPHEAQTVDKQAFRAVQKHAAGLRHISTTRTPCPKAVGFSPLKSHHLFRPIFFAASGNIFSSDSV